MTTPKLAKGQTVDLLLYHVMEGRGACCVGGVGCAAYQARRTLATSHAMPTPHPHPPPPKRWPHLLCLLEISKSAAHSSLPPPKSNPTPLFNPTIYPPKYVTKHHFLHHHHPPKSKTPTPSSLSLSPPLSLSSLSSSTLPYPHHLLLSCAASLILHHHPLPNQSLSSSKT